MGQSEPLTPGLAVPPFGLLGILPAGYLCYIWQNRQPRQKWWSRVDLQETENQLS
jgi:hypothetical protein